MTREYETMTASDATQPAPESDLITSSLQSIAERRLMAIESLSRRIETLQIERDRLVKIGETTVAEFGVGPTPLRSRDKY